MQTVNQSSKTKDQKEEYKPSEIEQKWQQKWEEEDLYKALDLDTKKKFYTLIEFPYPSGAGLHVGHVRSWSAMDAYSRKKRMEGLNVLYPIGWDAFGLPAENYAIKNKIHPSVAVEKNIATFKRQIKSLGISFDWSREVNTTDPNYYKWTQWIFLKFLEKGLAFQADVAVNWCPFCKTNLADEEVLADGTHERCGNQTEKRMQKQWLLKITKYADKLIEDLKLVDFSQKIAVQQVNWIGQSEGNHIEFEVKNSELKIKVFSTALDTIFGTTFMVLSPEYAEKLLDYVAKDKKESVISYIEKALRKSELERQSEEKVKTGVDTGIKSVNPFNDREIPIFVADYVLSTYGTGAVMGVPAHDARDYEFAKKYNLPIIPVIKPSKENNTMQVSNDGFLDYSEIKKYSDTSILFNSDNFDGISAKEAKKKLEEELVRRDIGEKVVNYHLRDWVFSRQHYWGEPIPVVYCANCAKEKVSKVSQVSKVSEGDKMEYAVVPVPEDQLPVELPYLEKYEPSGTGESPLANVKDWVNTKCPACGGEAKRETDTMPNWAGSNWYYLAYLFANKLKTQNLELKTQNSETEKKDIFEENGEVIKYWMPVDLYQGGFEHTTLHLLYSRFVYKFLYDIGVVPTPEPYAKRRSHGIVLGPDGKKMSKSFGNVINPDDIVGKFGADTLRVYEMFMGPFEQTIAWSEEGVEGCFRFLKRVWHLSLTKTSDNSTSLSLAVSLNKAIKKVGEDLENMKFNTAVAAMMEFINEWQKDENGLSKEDLNKFLLILSPFAPHVTEELYNRIRNQELGIMEDKQDPNSLFIIHNSIHTHSWPKYDPKLLEEDVVTVVVQVNGKVRENIKVQSLKLKAQSDVEQLAKESDKVQQYLQDKQIKKVVYVPGKIINFVLN